MNASMSFGESDFFASYKGVMKDAVEIGKRIKRLRLNILGIPSQAAFAKPLDVTRGAVGNWELGQGIKRENITKIAEAYRVSADWLATGRGNPELNEALTTEIKKPVKIGMVPIKGRVKAGDWQDIDSWGAGTMEEWVPSSGEYPLEWQYAYTVDGESLNRTARHGDRLICLDLGESGATFDDGDLVIVERSRFNGQMVERTAKRARRTIHGFELWPESDDPDHQEAIEYRGSEDDHVRVVARVLWVMRKP